MHAYLFYLSGGYYQSWPGSILEKCPLEELRWDASTLDRMKAGFWRLPFDFAAFDHQPKTSEVVAFDDLTITVEAAVVPEYYKGRFRQLAGYSRDFHYNATFVSRSENKVFDVKGRPSL